MISVLLPISSYQFLDSRLTKRRVSLQYAHHLALRRQCSRRVGVNVEAFILASNLRSV